MGSAVLFFIGNEYVFRGTFEQRSIPREAGFRFDDARKAWTTRHAHIARKVPATLCTVDAQRALGWHEGQYELSSASDSAFQAPSPIDCTYLPYQRAGIQYVDRALQRYPGALIADEPGLGKTIQAIGLLNQRPEWSKVLVVCPTTPKINWAREWEKWAVHRWNVEIIFADKGAAPFSQRADAQDRKVKVINYDLLEKHLDYLKNYAFDLIIFDEAHYLKNPEAKRTKAALAIPAAKRLFLTGTPILNRPAELWTIANACAPNIFPEWWDFARLYCAARKRRVGRRDVWDFSGASNLDQLQYVLRSNLMIRRRKADVLADLPPKRRQVITLEAPAAVEREARAWAANVASLGYEEAVKRLRSAPAALEDMAQIRADLARAKVKPAVAHIEGVLEAEEKTVVFAHHRVTLNKLHRHLSKHGVVEINGDVPSSRRAALVDSFQTDSNIRIFLGQIQAAGEAITLTAAQHVVFIEQDWTPGRNEQAEDRAHRIGQAGSVLIQYLVFDGSLDAHLAQACLRKDGVINRAVNSQKEEIEYEF